MSETGMVELVRDAFAGWGIEDDVLAVGQFEPRGNSGAGFAGGMLGGGVGDLAGGIAGGIGVGAGMLGGRAANQARSGLPREMLVAVTPSTVYGLTARTRHSRPESVVFAVPRADLTVRVHQRVNVRILELVHDRTGAQIELEGNRIPLTHSKDVIAVLTGPA
jgi:hypothetical protein